MDNHNEEKLLVSVSGYNYTGASAVVDLLREYQNVSVVKPELAFVYLPDGLIDLDYSINSAPTYLNGDSAINRFVNLCQKCGFPRNMMPQFIEATNNFISSIVELDWRGKSSFDGTRMDGISYSIWEFKRLLSAGIFHYFRRTTHLNERKMYFSHRDSDFYEKTNTYLNQVLDIAAPSCRIAVFNQFFSAFQPDQSMRYMTNAKTIVVDRDPRDVYILGHVRHETGSFPSDNAKNFVTWYKRCWDSRQKNNSEKTLIINFEDIVLEYDSSVKKIETFLGLKEHYSPGLYFKPEVSVNNTQLKWRFPELSEDIAYIENMLAEYLYPFKEERPATGDFF